MLIAEAVEKSYGDIHALRGVSLGVEAGEILGLLGPNGAGKTTFVSLVAGLLRLDAGRVWIDGIDVTEHPDAARTRIGVAPQETGVYPVVTVRNNLRLFGAIAGLKGRALTGRIDEIADALAIGDLLDRKAGNLSGGQKRRLHTAIALIHQPPLLLLDEATTGTDVTTRKHLLELIRSLAESGSAILYTTHYLHEVEEMGARVSVIEDGAVIAEGGVAELVAETGGGALELTFDGPAPQLDSRFTTHVDGNVVRVLTTETAVTAAAILGSLNDDAHRLLGLEVINPSLETVYLRLTGRRYQGGDEAEEDVAVA